MHRSRVREKSRAPHSLWTQAQMVGAMCKHLKAPHARLVPLVPLPFLSDGSLLGSPWYRQIPTLSIEQGDFLIAADLPGNPNAGAAHSLNAKTRN